ncbi:BrxA/BrxB family bacilliredoxin [bacterium]|nr:BrxA/BrxB family bacilliredoxin [bacterium]
MNERIIELTEINPNDFFGAHNSTVEQLKRYFPKIKIVARGSKLKIYGESELLDEFEKRLEMLIKYFNRYNKLDENSIERILTSTGKEAKSSSLKAKDVLVHGVNGRLIKPQTENQRKMVSMMQKNDMLFAVGPAGTGKTYTAVASLQFDKKPDNLTTVFAGVDKESTQKAREHMVPFPPSSPAVALFKDGELVHMLERHHIEGRSAQMIAENLVSAYNEFC